ncbi:MAG: hypothetical protein MHMPM18_003125, partial [Marteilia pararefringens]
FINPKPFLTSLIGKKVVVELKWHVSYIGILISTDSYFNVRLSCAEEFCKNSLAGFVGDMFIRCNNVHKIRKFRDANASGLTGGGSSSDSHQMPLPAGNSL